MVTNPANRSGGEVVVEVLFMVLVKRDDKPGNARLIAATPVMYGIIRSYGNIRRIPAGRVTKQLGEDAEALIKKVDLED